MKQHRFSMYLSPQQLMHYYRGQAKNVVVQSDTGQSLQIPLSALRPYVGHQGIDGYFLVVTDDNDKLQTLEKIG